MESYGLLDGSVKFSLKIKGGQPVREWKDSRNRPARWTLDWV
jgi:hypothetical protein